MRVIELAKDLEIEPEALIRVLREMGVHVTGQGAQVAESDVSRVRLRMERERRTGKREASAEKEVSTGKRAASTGKRVASKGKGDASKGKSDASEATQAAIEEASAGPKRRRRRKAEEPDEAPAPEAAVETSAETQAAAPEGAGQPEPAAESPSEPAPLFQERAPEPEEAPAPALEPPAAAAEPEEARPRFFDTKRGGPIDKPQPARKGAAEGPARILVRRPTPPPAPAPQLFGPTPTPAASAGPGGQVRIQAEGYTADGRRKVKEKKKGKKRQRVDQDAVQENIQRVMAELKGGGGKKRRRKDVMSREDQEIAELQAEEERERERKTVRVNEFLTVSELAELIDVPANQIIGSAFKNLSLMVTINQRLDFDQIEMLLDEFGFTAARETEYASAEAGVEEEKDRDEDLERRPPVVTVMGHVDHGKTLLLDRIRKTNVVAGEAGGITQHIGAYHVRLEDGRSLTFLDTPGHAAFTAMRARGAEVTDLVILMIAADDSVMPQTVEAISHAKNAGVPMIVAINKVDLPTANPQRVKQELLNHEVVLEEFGGTVLSSEVSAKTGKGIDELLEKVLLQAEMLDLKENPNREASGTVIEAQLDTGKGAVVTVLVQKGTLHVGDNFLCGLYDGRVRALLDERGKSVSEAGPGIPVQVLGAGGMPQAGDTFQAMNAVHASEVALTRQRLEREKQLRVKERGLKLGDFSQLVGAGGSGKLLVVIKCDADGSVQAVSDALEQLSTSEVSVEVIHRSVGAINESDVLLAQTARALIVGFRVRPDAKARQLAVRDGVEIKLYDVIYNAVNDVRALLEGLLAPEVKESVVGAAEVREVFRISRVGTIAGCYVTEGTVDRKSKVRLIRDGSVVYTGEIASLKRFKDDAREVREGFECGIGILNFNDVKVGDIIECFKVESIARTLAGAGADREH
jgi:translation initiation factor IF-2